MDSVLRRATKSIKFTPQTMPNYTVPPSRIESRFLDPWVPRSRGFSSAPPIRDLILDTKSTCSSSDKSLEFFNAQELIAASHSALCERDRKSAKVLFDEIEQIVRSHAASLDANELSSLGRAVCAFRRSVGDSVGSDRFRVFIIDNIRLENITDCPSTIANVVSMRPPANHLEILRESVDKAILSFRLPEMLTILRAGLRPSRLPEYLESHWEALTGRQAVKVFVHAYWNDEIRSRASNQILTKFDSITLNDAVLVLKTARNAKQFRDLSQVCLAEVERNIYRLELRQMIDVLCVLADARKLDFAVPALVGRISQQIPKFTQRQLSLTVWALGRREPRIASEFVQEVLMHLDRHPEVLLGFSARDTALVLQGLVRSLKQAKDPKSVIKVGFAFLPKIEQTVLKNKSSFQESAVSLLAITNMRDAGRKMSIDSSICDSIILGLIPRISAHLRSGRSSPSVESMLTIAWAMGVNGFKSQPVLIDLYRALYSRSDRMNTNQAAFAYFLFTTLSGVRDMEIANELKSRFATDIASLSNENLTNAIIALKEGSQDNGFQDAVFNEAYSRATVLSQTQLVTVAKIGAELDDRDNFKTFLEVIESQVSNFSVNELIKLLASEIRTELPWSVQRELAKRFRNLMILDNVSSEDLLLVAGEVRKRGPFGVKTSLRLSFNKILVRAIEQRKIPTPALLTNLKLVDDIGAWHCLEIVTQTSLWSKATDNQKRDVRPPLDKRESLPWEVRRRFIDTSRTLVRIRDTLDPSKGEEALDKRVLQKAIRRQEEKQEMEDVTGDRPAISEFIEILHRPS